MTLSRWFSRNDNDDDLAAGVENAREMADAGYQAGAEAPSTTMGTDQMQAFGNESLRSITTAQSAGTTNTAAGGAAASNTAQ